jgi:hypothetical protein
MEGGWIDDVMVAKGIGYLSLCSDGFIFCCCGGCDVRFKAWMEYDRDAVAAE